MASPDAHIGSPKHSGRGVGFNLACAVAVLISWVLGLVVVGAGATKNSVYAAYMFQIDARNIVPATMIQPHERSRTYSKISSHSTNYINDTAPITSMNFEKRTLNLSLAEAAARSGTAQSPPTASDFYNVYLWSYCSGQYKPNSDGAVQPGTFHYHFGIQWCSPKTMAYGFNTIAALQAGLPQSISLPDFDPSPDNSRAVWVTIVTGLIIGGCAWVLSTLLLLTNNRILERMMCIAVIASCLSMLCASISSTYLIANAIAKWNENGLQTKIAAYYGGLFLVLIWSSTTLYFFGAIGLTFLWKRDNANGGLMAGDGEKIPDFPPIGGPAPQFPMIPIPHPGAA